MTTYRGTDTVAPGLYFNLREWSFRFVEHAGTLPGTLDTRYRRLPMVAMLAAGPLLGLAFVVFLPFIGFAMVAYLVAGKAAALAGDAARAAARVLRPNWEPSFAFFARSKRSKKMPTEPVADSWAKEVEEKLNQPKDDR